MLTFDIDCESQILREAFAKLLEESGAAYVDTVRQTNSGEPSVRLLVGGQEDRTRRKIRESKRLKPQVRVIVLGLWPSLAFGHDCMGIGADGFTDHTILRSELLRAMRWVDVGNRWFLHAPAEPVPTLQRSHPKSGSTLSAREREVFDGIRSGTSMKEIAHRLNISVKTASTYRRRVLDKLALNNNAEIIRFEDDI